MALVRHALGRAERSNRHRLVRHAQRCEQRDSQLFYSFSIDGGNNWSRNVAVSNSFNPSVGYPNQNKIGDYITVVSDDASANVAYAATFNGEEDIYYVRIPPLPSLTDFNTDARPDFLLFNAGTRQTAVWYMNNNVRIGSC